MVAMVMGSSDKFDLISQIHIFKYIFELAQISSSYKAYLLVLSIYSMTSAHLFGSSAKSLIADWKRLQTFFSF